MSKAFTSEETADTAVLGRPARRADGALRPITTEGHAALREALRHATEELRPALRVSTEPDAPAQRAALEHRINFLLTTLESVTPIAPPAPDGTVRFGSRVTLEQEDGALRQVRIVGPDEADTGAGTISTESPLAAALLGRQVGDEVELKRPRGVVTAVITEVDSRR